MNDLILDRNEEFFWTLETTAPSDTKIIDEIVLLKPAVYINEQKMRNTFSVREHSRRNLEEKPYVLLSKESLRQLMLCTVYGHNSTDLLQELAERLIDSTRKYYSRLQQEIERQSLTYPQTTMNKILSRISKPRDMELLGASDRIKLEEMATAYYEGILSQQEYFMKKFSATHPGIKVNSELHNNLRTYFIDAMALAQADPITSRINNRQTDARILADTVFLSIERQKPMVAIVGDPQYKDMIEKAVKKFHGFFREHIVPLTEDRGFNISVYLRYKYTGMQEPTIFKTMNMDYYSICGNPTYRPVLIK